MMSQIDMRPACGCLFVSFPRAGTGISHMGKNNGNPDLVCEKSISDQIFLSVVQEHCVI